jgi:hypothetical protein
MDCRSEAKNAVKHMRLMITSMVVMVALVISQSVVAAQSEGTGEPKMISGISIVGNKEAPKSLFIVPWKSSEIGVETSLHSGLMDDSMRPVDKDVFMREIDYYDIRHAK